MFDHVEIEVELSFDFVNLQLFAYLEHLKMQQIHHLIQTPVYFQLYVISL